MKIKFLIIALFLTSCATTSIDNNNFIDNPNSEIQSVKKNNISNDKISAYIHISQAPKETTKSAKLFMKVTSENGKTYDNIKEMIMPYQVFFNKESINQTGNIRLSKDGLVYLVYLRYSNAMVMREPSTEYYRLGSYTSTSNAFTEGSPIELKLDPENSIKMLWRMGEVSREGIQIFLAPNSKPVKTIPVLI